VCVLIFRLFFEVFTLPLYRHLLHIFSRTGKEIGCENCVWNKLGADLVSLSGESKYLSLFTLSRRVDIHEISPPDQRSPYSHWVPIQL